LTSLELLAVSENTNSPLAVGGNRLRRNFRLAQYLAALKRDRRFGTPAYHAEQTANQVVSTRTLMSPTGYRLPRDGA
jgi:hypothetical protein